MKDELLSQKKAESPTACIPATTARGPKANAAQDPKIKYRSGCTPEPPGPLHSSLAVCPADTSRPSFSPSPALGRQQALGAGTIFQVGPVIFSFPVHGLGVGDAACLERWAGCGRWLLNY